MSNEWLDGYAKSLVQQAARRAPASLSERLEEEWLADLEARQGALARLRFGIGCCWATKVIAHEYLEPKVATATAGSSAATTAAPRVRPDYSFFSRRTTAVLAILGLHALIIYGFATGLVRSVIEVVSPPIVVIPAPPHEVERPPDISPHPKFWQPTVVVDPDRLPRIDDATATLSVEKGMEEYRALPPPTDTPASVIKRVQGGPAKGFPNTDDYYPARLIRDRTTGSATVRACTDEKGRLTGEPTVAQTSGNAELDQAALRLAKAGSGHYRPTMEDDRAVSACFPFRVTYTLRN